MHILITVAGKRTEHWTDLFDALCERPEVTLTVLAADVSPTTRHELDRLARRHRRLRYHVVPHLFGEELTGHMATVLFRLRRQRDLPAGPPDVVHIIGEAAYLTTWQVLRLRRRLWPTVPTTLYAAQNVVMRFPAPFPALERRAYRTVDHAFPITPAALEVLRMKGYRGAATIVPLGVDTHAFRPRPPTPAGRRFTVGFVGRFEPHKGVLDLLRAAELIDCDVLLVGGGSLLGEVERAARRRPGRITLLGWTGHDELPSLLADLHVLVLPSIEVTQRNLLPWIGIALREQFGRVLVEAMACGVPVVGSDVGEIPHVIGTAGLVFPAGDVTALAERLTRLRDQPALARQLAEEGLRRAAAEFSWDGIADSLCATWRRLGSTTPACSPPADGDDPAGSGPTREAMV